MLVVVFFTLVSHKSVRGGGLSQGNIFGQSQVRRVYIVVLPGIKPLMRETAYQ